MKVMAPARIDLSGGTLDIPPLCFMIEGTITLNLAINLRARITTTPSSQTLIREGDAPPVELTGMPLYEKAFAYFPDSDPLTVSIKSDIPRASGLGGSSSTLVALVSALRGAVPETGLERRDVLQQVTVLEHRLLGKPAGTQDAAAAIYGGLSRISFDQGLPFRQSLEMPSFLKGPLYLAYSNIQHHSGINNWAIVRGACEQDQEIISLLQNLCANAHDMEKALIADDTDHFMATLLREAALREQLCPEIMTPDMAAFSKAFGDRLACKVCGAGGGGAMFLFGEDLDRDELEHQASRTGLQIIETGADSEGCRGMAS